MSIQSDDYDSPWKEIMEVYFNDFMAFFFPDIAEEVDWDRGYTFLDKELQQVVRDAESFCHSCNGSFKDQGDPFG